MADNIRRALAALALPHELSPLRHVSVSCGVAAMVPGKDGTPAQLVELADQALYQAKAGGRNRVQGA